MGGLAVLGGDFLVATLAGVRAGKIAGRGVKFGGMAGDRRSVQGLGLFLSKAYGGQASERDYRTSR